MIHGQKNIKLSKEVLDYNKGFV